MEKNYLITEFNPIKNFKKLGKVTETEISQISELFPIYF
jgi:hypothetical protein